MTEATIITKMQQLADVLQTYYPATATTQLTLETLAALQATQSGVGFTGAMQQFLNRASVAKVSDGLTFSPEVEALWREVLDFKQLGNNLWGATL